MRARLLFKCIHRQTFFSSIVHFIDFSPEVQVHQFSISLCFSKIIKMSAQLSEVQHSNYIISNWKWLEMPVMQNVWTVREYLARAKLWRGVQSTFIIDIGKIVRRRRFDWFIEIKQNYNVITNESRIFHLLSWILPRVNQDYTHFR